MFELLPAAALLAVIAAACMKALALDLKLRDRMAMEIRKMESLSLARGRWKDAASLVILCNLDPGQGWTVVDFPDESWLPIQATGGHSIAWKQTVSTMTGEDTRYFSYRLDGMTQWQPWIPVKDWDLPLIEPHEP